MKVLTDAGSFELGTLEAGATIGIVDYSRRVTDDFGVTTIVKRGFARRMSVNLGIPFDQVDEVQEHLASLRATPATWVADERFASFAIYGFYKDFEVNFAVPPLSFCSLTVEGMAEEQPFADPGGDPALEGRSTLRLLDPVEIVGARLESSTVPENDAPAWAAGTTYSTGARVILAATHRIYESVVDDNVGADPSGTGGKWLDVGPTNRWAAFDQALGSRTILGSDVEVVLRPGTAIGAIALLDTSAGSVRVRAPGYDRTQYPTGGKVLFLDLAVAAGDAITITATPAALVPGDRRWDDGAQWMDDGAWQDSQAAGDSSVIIGTMLVGSLKDLGVTEAAPTTGITDYSRKVTDDFGDTTVVQRAWSKRMSAKAAIRTDAIDLVMGRMATVRAKPCLWLGDQTVDALAVYGFFRDFDISVGETLSMLSLSIEGLSKAPPQAAPVPAATSVVAEGSADGASWHLGLEAGDVFMRISNDGGATFGAAIRIVGEAGEDGSYQQQVFRRSPTQPATPTGGGIPAGWSDGVPSGSDLIWLSIQYQRNGLALGPWTTPAQIKGDKGEPGEKAPLIATQWSVDGLGGWHDDFAEGDLYQRQSNDNGATWGPAIRVVGEAGESTVGADGSSPSSVFRRSATVPATPAINTGNPPPGWSDGPPGSTGILWQSNSKFRGATQLQAWSPPVRITGDKGEPGTAAPLVRTQWSVDGVGGWHNAYAEGDLYQRQSNDAGATWGPGVRVVGESGASTAGQDGSSPSIIFRRSATVPATPAINTGNPPPGWSDGPPAGADLLWQSVSRFRGPVQLDPWSPPVRITGPKGDKGDDSQVPGPPGRNAVVFQQDLAPSNPVVGDTWVTVSAPKVWRKWDGTSWSKLLGNVSAVDIIDEAYIADLSVGTGKIANLAVTSLQIANNAVTISGGSTAIGPVVLYYDGDGPWPLLNTYTIALPYGGTIMAFASAYVGHPDSDIGSIASTLDITAKQISGGTGFLRVGRKSEYSANGSMREVNGQVSLPAGTWQIDFGAITGFGAPSYADERKIFVFASMR